MRDHTYRQTAIRIAYRNIGGLWTSQDMLRFNRACSIAGIDRDELLTHVRSEISVSGIHA